MPWQVATYRMRHRRRPAAYGAGNDLAMALASRIIVRRPLHRLTPQRSSHPRYRQRARPSHKAPPTHMGLLGLSARGWLARRIGDVVDE